MLSSCADYTSSSQHSQTDVHLSLFANNLEFYSSQPPSRSSSLPTFTCSTSPQQLILLSPETNGRSIFTTEDPFVLHYSTQIENHSMVKMESDHLLIDLTHAEQQHQDIVISPQAISNASSPSKHRVLNTPERLIQVKFHW